MASSAKSVIFQSGNEAFGIGAHSIGSIFFSLLPFLLM